MKKLLVILLISLIFSCERDETNNVYKEKTYAKTTVVKEIFGVKIGKKSEEFKDNIILVKRPDSPWGKEIGDVFPSNRVFYFKPKPEFENKLFTMYAYDTSYHFDKVYKIRAFGICQGDSTCNKIVKELGKMLLELYPDLHIKNSFLRDPYLVIGLVGTGHEPDSVYTSLTLTDETSEFLEDIRILIIYRRNLWVRSFGISRDDERNAKGYLTIEIESHKFGFEGWKFKYNEDKQKEIEKFEELVKPDGFAPY